VSYTLAGQEYDDELGFYNYKARLYDPLVGRFITPDRIVPRSDDPQSMNRYSYAINNPIRHNDPTGKAFADQHFEQSFFAAIAYGLGFWGSLKFAMDVVMVDIKVKDPNVHALRGKDPQTGLPQTLEQAQQGMKSQMGKTAAQDTHSRQDAVTHSFAKNPETILEWVLHILEDLFTTPQQHQDMFNAALQTLRDYSKKQDPKATDPVNPKDQTRPEENVPVESNAGHNTSPPETTSPPECPAPESIANEPW